MFRRRRRLLLADGDPARAERLGRRLAGMDLEIQRAENGARALLMIHESAPDVVVAAGEMPVLDGYLMLEALRAQAPTAAVPVILLTESASDEALTRGWRAGADLCIPCQGEADVLATLHRALASLLGEEPEAPLEAGRPVSLGPTRVPVAQAA